MGQKQKIGQYFSEKGYVFICWGIFAVTITILCSLVSVWIISTGETNNASGDGQRTPTNDTVYIVVKPEFNELRVASYSVNKDSIWIAPTSSKVENKKSVK